MSQDNQEPSFNPHAKAALFFYWGYYRSGCTSSNIHFEGPGYRFALEDVINAKHLPYRAIQEFWFIEHLLSIDAAIPINVNK